MLRDVTSRDACGVFLHIIITSVGSCMANKVTFLLNLRGFGVILGHISFPSYHFFYMWTMCLWTKVFGSFKVYRHCAAWVIRVNFSSGVGCLRSVLIQIVFSVNPAMTMRLHDSRRIVGILFLHISLHKFLQWISTIFFFALCLRWPVHTKADVALLSRPFFFCTCVIKLSSL